MNLIYTKQGLMELEFEELEEHERATWNYFRKVKAVLKFRSLGE